MTSTKPKDPTDLHRDIVAITPGDGLQSAVARADRLGLSGKERDEVVYAAGHHDARHEVADFVDARLSAARAARDIGEPWGWMGVPEVDDLPSMGHQMVIRMTASQLRDEIDRSVQAAVKALEDLGRSRAEEAAEPEGWAPWPQGWAPWTADGVGDVMPLAEYLESVKSGSFIDYDGYGHCLRSVDDDLFEVFKPDGRNVLNAYPSDAFEGGIPEGTTHIVWFNR